MTAGVEAPWAPAPPRPERVEPAHRAGPSGRVRRWVRGQEADPVWARPALLVLLAATTLLYTWALSASGWANGYYAAAVQAGSESWKAFFYGSFDASNYITVDKTPASLWLPALAARVFGMNSWTLLLPQALMGVATVGVVYAAVRRYAGPAAGLIAGAVVATTPVAALIFRFDNPDALLVLLLTVGAYATLRAVESGRTGWLLLAGTMVGFGFLTKMLQAVLVLPAFALAYLLFGPPKLGRRLVQLLAGGLAVLVSAGWWVAIVELVPESSRPYIGGSTTNSILELTLGYNGLGRITGNETGAVVPGGGGAGGPGRAPAAACGARPASCGCSPRRPGRRRRGCCRRRWWRSSPACGRCGGRRGSTRCAPRSWSGAGGCWSPPRCSASWPASSTRTTSSRWPRRWVRWSAPGRCCCGGGAASCGRGWCSPRRSPAAGSGPRCCSVGCRPGTPSCGTAWRSPRWSARWRCWCRRCSPGGGPWAWRRSGWSRCWPRPGRTRWRRRRSRTPGRSRRPARRARRPVARAAAGWDAGCRRRAGTGGRRPGGTGGQAAPGGVRVAPVGRRPRVASPAAPGRPRPGTGTRGGPGGGGPGGSTTVDSALVTLLQQDADAYQWAAATTSASGAAPYQLASGEPVLAVGGFNGTDQSTTLAAFQRLVAEGKVHYWIGGGGFGGAQVDGVANQIAAWVAESFEAQTVGGATVYDLTAATAAG